MNGNDPAFATPTTTFKDWSGGEETEVTRHGQPGLTKREFFAGLVMQALLTNGDYEFHGAGIDAVKFADGLIKALSEPPK